MMGYRLAYCPALHTDTAFAPSTVQFSGLSRYNANCTMFDRSGFVRFRSDFAFVRRGDFRIESVEGGEGLESGEWTRFKIVTSVTVDARKRTSLCG